MIYIRWVPKLVFHEDNFTCLGRNGRFKHSKMKKTFGRRKILIVLVMPTQSILKTSLSRQKVGCSPVPAESLTQKILEYISDMLSNSMGHQECLTPKGGKPFFPSISKQ